MGSAAAVCRVPAGHGAQTAGRATFQWKSRLDREAREKALAQWQATKKEKRAFQRFHRAFPSLQVHKWEQRMNQLKERIQKKEEG